MENHSFIGIAVEAVVGVIGFFIVFILKDIRKAIDEARASVDQLNVKVAIVIEKTANHERLLDDHSDRLRTLEKPGG